MTVLKIKAAVRSRDGYRCVECGMTNEEHITTYRKSLHVHRKTPGGDYALDSCETVCYQCHGRRPRLPRSKVRRNDQTSREHFRYLAVPVALWEQLKEIADADERSMSWAARRAVAEYVERHKLPPGV